MPGTWPSVPTTAAWGYPTSDQYGIRGGVAQKFQGAVVTYVGGRVRP